MHPIDYISDQSQSFAPEQVTLKHGADDTFVSNEALRCFLIDSARYLGLPLEQIATLNLQQSIQTPFR